MKSRTSEQTAWVVLWAAFILFCLLLVGLPSTGYWFVQNAMEAQTITLAAGDGVLVTRPGRAVPEANLESLPVGSIISTGIGDQTTLTFIGPDKDETLASVQLFGDTRVTVAAAESPRFQWGIRPHRIQLNLDTGRIQLFSIQGITRPMEIAVISPLNVQTLITSTGAIASIDVSSPQKTIITVRAGQAVVMANGGSLPVQSDQLAVADANLMPRLAPTTEQELIVNGDFQGPLEENWRIEVQSPGIPTESPGEVRSVTTEGRRAVQFFRTGSGPSQIGIIQDINQDVRGFKSLRLRMDVLITFQDLFNCGAQGTECPVMVRLLYTDTSGADREWVQGFFLEARYNPSNPLIYGFSSCVPCIPRNEHQQWPANQWRQYESENLLDVFNAINRPAVVIKSITLYASGHTYDSKVTQVQLVAE